MAMSASPSVSRSGGRGALAHAETNPRTIVGLQRVDAQLQHELEKIDRQAFTAVSNIANHQQAMKMSWRRLETQRNSPKQRPRSRSCSDQLTPRAALRRPLLSSNTTKLYVSATPRVYSGSQLPQEQEPALREDEAPVKDNAVVPTVAAKDDADVPRSCLSSYRGLKPPSLFASPYLSSPYMYRRSPVDVTRSSSPLLKVDPPHLPTSTPSISAPQTCSSSQSRSTVKLPPILTSISQPSLVATTNKETLLKVSHIMGLDSHSLGPKSFCGFYRDKALVRGRTGPEDQFMGEEDGDSGEGEEEEEEGGGEEGRELSLAEQFEQIRKCRYIRHYRPDGTALTADEELYQ